MYYFLYCYASLVTYSIIRHYDSFLPADMKKRTDIVSDVILSIACPVVLPVLVYYHFSARKEK